MLVITNGSVGVYPYVKDVTGIILAGGKSSRFGENKALVGFDGIPLIEKVTRVISSIFKEVLIVSNTPEEYEYLGFPIKQDIIKNLGPIGGIYTGLKSIKNPAGFVVACDMPFLSPDLIRHIVEVQDDYDIIIPKVDWMMEPLHALYTNRCISPLKELIDTGERKTFLIFEKVRVKYLTEKILRSFDPQLRFFININRTDDLQMALELQKKNNSKRLNEND